MGDLVCDKCFNLYCAKEPPSECSRVLCPWCALTEARAEIKRREREHEALVEVSQGALAEARAALAAAKAQTVLDLDSIAKLVKQLAEAEARADYNAQCAARTDNGWHVAVEVRRAADAAGIPAGTPEERVRKLGEAAEGLALQLLAAKDESADFSRMIGEQGNRLADALRDGNRRARERDALHAKAEAAEAEAVSLREAAPLALLDVPTPELAQLFYDGSDSGCYSWEDLVAEHEEADEDEKGATQYTMICESVDLVRRCLVEKLHAALASHHGEPRDDAIRVRIAAEVRGIIAGWCPTHARDRIADLIERGPERGAD